MNPIFAAPVVCNAGPLIGLARVNLAWLPFRLFPEVIMPEEVRIELLVKESPDHGQLITALEQARIHQCHGKPDPLLHAELDSGEAAVIATALELGVSTVVLDEKNARRLAAHIYGLNVKGTAGLLVEAKHCGLIQAVKPYLNGMIQGGYFLGSNLVSAWLDAAGES
jgi:predicted nucleic acid-binding protein